MKFKTILVSICLIMAAANASFANGENDKCNNDPITCNLTNPNDNKISSCTITLTINGRNYTGTATCECEQKDACRQASSKAFMKAIDVFRPLND